MKWRLRLRDGVAIGAGVVILASGLVLAHRHGGSRRRELGYGFRRGLSVDALLRAHGPPSWTGTDEAALREVGARGGLHFALPPASGTCPVEYPAADAVPSWELRLAGHRALLFNIDLLRAVLVYVDQDGKVACTLLGSS